MDQFQPEEKINIQINGDRFQIKTKKYTIQGWAAAQGATVVGAQRLR